MVKKIYLLPLFIFLMVFFNFNRIFSSTYTVSNTNDDTYPGSLRWAITQANENIGSDTINFSISGIITPNVELPSLSDTTGGTIIDAGTEHNISIDGTILPNTASEIIINSSNNIISGLGIWNSDYNSANYAGIEITGMEAQYNTIKNCYIGFILDSYNNFVRKNNAIGIYIHNGASFNIIGSTIPEEKNIIAGNYYYDNWWMYYGTGIKISDPGTESNQIIGNYIGVYDGIGYDHEMQNFIGIRIENGASFNVIGGEDTNKRNIISNNVSGIEIYSSGTDNNMIINNYIGLAPNGIQPFGENGTGISIFDGASKTLIKNNVISGLNDGIYMSSSTSNYIYFTRIIGNKIGTDYTGKLNLKNLNNGIQIHNNCIGNTIGGTLDSEKNIIAYNGRNGIYIASNTSEQNRISGNSIFENEQKGIDLENGANNQMDFPVITNIVQTGVNKYIITGTAPQMVEVQIFQANVPYSNIQPDPSGFGEGYKMLTYLSSDYWGNFSTGEIEIPAGAYLTATSIDINGNTSEFGENYYVAPNIIDIALSDPSPTIVTQGNTNILLTTLKLNTDSNEAIWTGLKLDGNNEINFDLTEIKLYKDDGNGIFDALSDTFLCNGTFVNSSCQFMINSEKIQTAQSTYFIVGDISLNASCSDKINLSIKDTSYFTFDEPDVLGAFNTFTTKDIKIIDKPDTTIIFPESVDIKSVNTGSNNVLFEKLNVRTSNDQVILNAISIKLVGTAADSDVSMIKIYQDDGDGIFRENNDQLIGSGIFNNNLSNINITEQSLNTLDKLYFITLSISKDAQYDNTIGITLPDTSYFSIVAPDTISQENFPINSDIATITDYESTLTNLIAYPNPWRRDSNSNYIVFENLTKNSMIRIYTIDGKLVCNNVRNDHSEWLWDLKNDNGNEVDSGIYIYTVTNANNEKKVGKIAIIK